MEIIYMFASKENSLPVEPAISDKKVRIIYRIYDVLSYVLLMAHEIL